MVMFIYDKIFVRYFVGFLLDTSYTNAIICSLKQYKFTLIHLRYISSFENKDQVSFFLLAYGYSYTFVMKLALTSYYTVHMLNYG